jgi:hypothetical protein
MAQSACHHAHVADRQDSDREVLTSLPRSRPVRRSAKRGARPGAPAAARPKATSAAADAPKGRRPAAKPRATAQPKTTARATRPASRATAAGANKAQTTAGKAHSTRSTTPRRTIPPAGYASASQSERSASADLVGTAVQAAGELAQIGFAIGRQTLQSMIDRLPKP